MASLAIDDATARPGIIEKKFAEAHGRLPTFWEESSRARQQAYLEAWRKDPTARFGSLRAKMEAVQPIGRESTSSHSGLRVEHEAEEDTGNAQGDILTRHQDVGSTGVGVTVEEGGQSNDNGRPEVVPRVRKVLRQGRRPTQTRDVEYDDGGLLGPPPKHSGRGGLGARRRRTVRRLQDAFGRFRAAPSNSGWFFSHLAGVTTAERADFRAGLSPADRDFLDSRPEAWGWKEADV